MTDCCIAALNRKRARENYEVYMTDVAYVIIKSLQGNNVNIPRYYDLIHPQPVDNRTGKDIAEDIIRRHGLKVVG